MGFEKANFLLQTADGLAQLVEQRPFKAWVLGSSPRPVTKLQEIGAFFILGLIPLKVTLIAQVDTCAIKVNNFVWMT